MSFNNLSVASLGFSLQPFQIASVFIDQLLPDRSQSMGGGGVKILITSLSCHRITRGLKGWKTMHAEPLAPNALRGREFAMDGWGLRPHIPAPQLSPVQKKGFRWLFSSTLSGLYGIKMWVKMRWIFLASWYQTGWYPRNR